MLIHIHTNMIHMTYINTHSKLLHILIHTNMTTYINTQLKDITYDYSY